MKSFDNNGKLVSEINHSRTANGTSITTNTQYNSSNGRPTFAERHHPRIKRQGVGHQRHQRQDPPVASEGTWKSSRQIVTATTIPRVQRSIGCNVWNVPDRSARCTRRSPEFGTLASMRLPRPTSAPPAYICCTNTGKSQRLSTDFSGSFESSRVGSDRGRYSIIILLSPPRHRDANYDLPPRDSVRDSARSIGQFQIRYEVYP